MTDRWKVLMDAGVPLGAIRPPPTHLDPAALRLALKDLLTESDALERRQRDALYAWLRGFKRHWPAGFQDVAGAEGEALLARLEEDPPEPNRYLKLKRIAVENLAGIV